MKKIIIYFILFFFSLHGFSQEMLLNLKTNPQLVKQSKLFNYSHSTKGPKLDTLTLPFIDDFSSSRVFPDKNLWEDKFVFINNSYPVFPVTIGVATFDALNDSGFIYKNASTDPFIADYLTSKPINLIDHYSIKDSLYLSFYFQPGGGIPPIWENFGNAPNSEDSLVLEFLAYPPDTTYIPADTIIKPLVDSNGVPIRDSLGNPKDTTIIIKDTTIINPRWNKVWGAAGMSLFDFHAKYKTYFKEILIPVKDSAYFHNHFRFRFKNYANLDANGEPGSQSGNIEQWYLDYVYLNSKRNKFDTLLKDVGYMQYKNSLLKNYQAMPWKHFLSNPTSFMIDSTSYSIPYKNFGDTTRNVKRLLNISDVSGTTPTYTLNGVDRNIDPDSIQYFPDVNPLYNFKINYKNYTFHSLTKDSASFLIKSFLTPPENSDINDWNDTVKFYQNFFNYYAYDDGTPENGYGLKGKNAKLGYKFTSAVSDTLRAIQMFFNQDFEKGNQVFFKLKIWKTLSPEVLIYDQLGLMPVYVDSLNEFYTYLIDSSKTIILSGTYYIGWEQVNDAFLNIGFDKNTNSSSGIFYNTDGTWRNTMFKGSLMIRPVFGKPLPKTTGIEENESQKTTNLVIYPNPLNNDILNIVKPNDAGSDKKLTIRISNIMGEQVYTSAFTNTINTSLLANGIYFVYLTNTENAKTFLNKLIICR